MSVVLRLSRQGSKKRPFYRIVAADKRCPRDGKFIELLGTYDPRTKVLKLDGERFDRWVKVGALHLLTSIIATIAGAATYKEPPVQQAARV